METDWEREYYALVFVFNKVKARIELLERDYDLMKSGLLMLADPRWTTSYPSKGKFAQDILDRLELDNE